MSWVSSGIEDFEFLYCDGWAILNFEKYGNLAKDSSTLFIILSFTIEIIFPCSRNGSVIVRFLWISWPFATSHLKGISLNLLSLLLLRKHEFCARARKNPKLPHARQHIKQGCKRGTDRKRADPVGVQTGRFSFGLRTGIARRTEMENFGILIYFQNFCWRLNNFTHYNRGKRILCTQCITNMWASIVLNQQLLLENLISKLKRSR